MDERKCAPDCVRTGEFFLSSWHVFIDMDYLHTETAKFVRDPLCMSSVRIRGRCTNNTIS